MTPEQMKRLSSPEFSAVLAEDPELIRLQELLRSGEKSIPALLDALLLPYEQRIGLLPVRSLTAAKWAFLWGLDNGAVCNESMFSISDCDVFLFVLSHDLRELCLTAPEIPGAASGYAAATGLPFEELSAEIRTVVENAFSPLGMIPEDHNEDSAVFDGFWLASVCGIAARESRMSYAEVLHEMPLSLVCNFFCSWFCREREDGWKVRRIPPGEVVQAIQNRTDALAEVFLKMSPDPDRQHAECESREKRTDGKIERP